MGLKRIRRFFKHWLTPPRHLHKHFSKSALQRIEAAVKNSEASHGGEIRVAIESSLRAGLIFENRTPRQRALELFSLYRVWDTEHNNGVLLYLLLADRQVEIIADRGIHRIVGNEVWQRICAEIEQAFKKGQFESGLLQGIQQIGALMEEHYPYCLDDENELPNRPIII
jgi:uncharacterized membrane protein